MRYFFYIAHLVCVIFYIAHLGVRYEIYTLAFPFDLRCQSGILYFTHIHTVKNEVCMHTIPMV